MRTNIRNRRFAFLWIVCIFILAIFEYYFITNYTGHVSYGHTIESRSLTSKEKVFFSEYFLNNAGFSMNFYDDITYLTIPKILDAGQGINLKKELTTKEKTDVINQDLKYLSTYFNLLEKPDTAFNHILSGKKLRELFISRTGYKEVGNNSTTHYLYNSKYDIYHNALLYESEKYPNNYEFENVEITSNGYYFIKYTAFYKVTGDDPKNGEYAPNQKEELYSGIIVLKKQNNKHYHFFSNSITNHLAYISKIENYDNKYNISNNIYSITKMLPATYYGDDKEHKATISKFTSGDNMVMYRVVPAVKTLCEEIYYFTNNKLTMYVQITPKGNTTYYYFENNIVDAKYQTLNDGSTVFQAYTQSIKSVSELLINKASIINNN